MANRDPQKTYNPRTLGELAQSAPSIDWKRYFAEAGLKGELPTLIVRQPEYLHGLSELIQTTPLPAWRAQFA